VATGESDTRREWVLRVLGVEIAAPGDATDPALLKQRLVGIGAGLKQLKAEGAAEFPSLFAAFQQASAADQRTAAAVGALEGEMARALSAMRGRAAAAGNPRMLDTTKLLLRWRGAQSKVAQALKDLGQTIIGLDAVRLDPRFTQVQAAVAKLPDLVPVFGGRLEDLLDSMMMSGHGGGAGDALAAIAAYRQQLASATVLSRLEVFAARYVSLDVALVRELDGTLVELERDIVESGRAAKRGGA
jgi:hypothetical protein